MHFPIYLFSFPSEATIILNSFFKNNLNVIFYSFYIYAFIPKQYIACFLYNYTIPQLFV